jgi:hypothetical protein
LAHFFWVEIAEDHGRDHQQPWADLSAASSAAGARCRAAAEAQSWSGRGGGRCELFVLCFPVGVQNARPCGVDVGHQIMGFLIAAIGVVPLGKGKIGRGKVPRRYRPDVDPEPMEQRECVVQ